MIDKGRPDPHVHHGLADAARLAAAQQLAIRNAAAFVGALSLGIAFGLLLLSVRVEWGPLRSLDQSVADSLNGLVSEREAVKRILIGITDLGGTGMLAWLLLIGGAWLLLRHQPWLAAYVVVTAAGAMILNSIVKPMVGRLRPVVDDPFYSVPGLSFPSGHAMSSLVCYGVLWLVFMPTATRDFTRRILTITTIMIVATVGVTRIALGVHFLTDVIAGWLLGLVWLTLSSLAFSRWRHAARVEPAGPLPGDVPPEDRADLRPVPEHHAPALSHPWRGIGELAVAWVLLAGTLTGAGILLRSPGTGDPQLPIDHKVVQWLADHRDPAITPVLNAAGALGSTGGVIAGVLIVAPLIVGILRSWRPALFVLIAVIGELSLFLATATVVGRTRPDVSQLNADLPPTASFPSGHVAAAAALWTATAIVAWTSTHRGWRRLIAAVAVVIPTAVAMHRLYAGVHYPTDVLGGIVLATVWVSAAWWVTEPLSPSAADEPTETT